ncbi:MAG: tripartite tricarboxylate transporter substrate binding protein [Xanthobacteraceae bacterium]|jgi:tripartite-type tricarboxylate transporter receptor subunit TctC
MVSQNNVPALLLSAALIAGAASPAVAQSWPDRPLTMVVPFGAGSASDTVGRVLAAGLSEVLGQQVIIENIAGGGSMTGTSRVAKSAPDGYQFVFASVDSIAIVPTMHKAPLYNSATDFSAVGLVVEQPIVLITRKDLPPNSMQEFAAYVKANQDKMQFGSSGVGSGSHFACSRLNAALGVNPTHVPYRGSGQAMQDLIGGRIDYFCALGAAAMGPLEGGTAKAVALLTGERSSLFPTLQTAKEQGTPGVDSYFWTAFFFPKDTPDAIVQKLNDATTQTLNTPATLERLKKAGVTAIAADQRSPAYLQKFVGTEVEKWRAMIKASGITLE